MNQFLLFNCEFCILAVDDALHLEDLAGGEKRNCRRLTGQGQTRNDTTVLVEYVLAREEVAPMLLTVASSPTSISKTFPCRVFTETFMFFYFSKV